VTDRDAGKYIAGLLLYFVQEGNEGGLSLGVRKHVFNMYMNLIYVGGKYFSVIHTSCFNLSKASIFVTQLTEN
jgi:hypothetical protein